MSSSSSSSSALPSPCGAGRRRLVDYIVVAGFDHELERQRRKRTAARDRGRQAAAGGYLCQGTILQRFPTRDWKDTPFIGSTSRL